MITHDDGSVTLSFDELQRLKNLVEFQHRNHMPEFGITYNRAWLEVSDMMRAANTHCTAVRLGLNPKDWVK